MRTCLSVLIVALVPSTIFSLTEIPQGVARLSEFRVNNLSGNNHTNSMVATDSQHDIYITWES